MNTIENYLDYEEIENLSKYAKKPIWLVKKGNKKLVKRLVTQDEAEVYKEMTKIENPHLPKIYAIIEADEDFYVLEEYIKGETLKKHLNNGVFSECRAEKIILQLCDALIALHNQNIIHRDIKSENVMLSGEKVYLIDFDISRFFEENRSNDTEILGTPGYAPPEQFGFKQSDERNDIYSIGILFNELLTGKVSNNEIYSGKFEEIIKKCIEFEPDKRYQSVQILKETLLGLSDKIKSEIKEEIDEINSTDKIFCIFFQLWVVEAFFTSYIYNCIDTKWALGFDFFAQLTREYLGDNYVHQGIYGFITSAPATAWMKMITLAAVLIFFFNMLKKRSVLSGIFLIGFFVYDLHWQLAGIINNSSIYMPGLPISHLDIINVVLHILSIGVIIKILYNKKKVDALSEKFNNR